MFRGLAVCLCVTATMSTAPFLITENEPARTGSSLSGSYVEARTCDVYTGPCFANSEFGLAGHNCVMAWSVESGMWRGVDLSGLHVAAAVKASDTLGGEFTHPLPARCVILVDSNASQAQQAALLDFAQAKGGELLENVVSVETQDIQMEVACCKKLGCSSLKVGKMIDLETRCAGDKDHICGNETVYYDPLTKLKKGYVAAVTVKHKFSGKGLNGTWSSPNKRSAFVGTFSD